MPKTPIGKQTNTLFSYFKKTPTQEKKTSPSKETNGVLSQRKSPNSHDKGLGLSAKSSPKLTCSEWKVGDIVWAKLEGYPWWPALVCNHPTQQHHLKDGKIPQIHVQFFDQPINRAWVKAKYAKSFKGSDDPDCQSGGPYFSYLNKIREASLDADKALAMSHEDRMSLIVELLPSSEEEEEEKDQEETMDFDPSIFDTEMSENEEKSTPSKKQNEELSPSKLTKSKRKAAKEAVIKTKRRKISRSESVEEDSSEDDFKPSKEDDEDDDSGSSGIDENEVSEPESASEADSPVKRPMKRKRIEPSSVKRPLLKSSPSDVKQSPTAVSTNTKSRLSFFAAAEISNENDESTSDVHNFPHLKLDFMQPDKIRDAARKRRNDLDYNPRTLYVPDHFLTKQTPAMRQWWELKSGHFDTILFFKVGKFYELYHMDAVIGITELGLIYMRGGFAHSGFPEIAYTRNAEALIKKGYKVARVEQTETPDMVNERCKNLARNPSKYDKVVKREVCQINSQSIRMYNHMEGVLRDASSAYILALCEKESTQEGVKVFGVCFIDTSIGTFHLGQFEDDRHLSRVRTVIAHYPPTQVLYEKGKISSQILQLINVNLANALKEPLNSGSEFWDSGKTLKTLMEEDYFTNDGGGDDGEEIKNDFPEVLKSMVSKSDALGLTAAESHDLAIRSLGAVTWYLQYCLVDHDMLSLKKFEEYKPVDDDDSDAERKSELPSYDLSQQHMVLDGVTMTNLDIVTNSQTGTMEGTLLEKLNMCSTAFGKRLFHQWLCAPLCQPASINDRLDAVEDLLGVPSIVDECVVILKKLPDLERLLGRIHTIGLTKRGKNHPDSRAILYEEVTYSKRKIEDFLTTIEGFKACVSMVEKFKTEVNNFKSKIISRSLRIQSNETDHAHFPDISDDLDFFDNAFDHKKAKRDGVIVPSKGVDSEYDTAISDINDLEIQLGDYLDAQKKALGCRNMTYWGTGKNRFQMEVPDAFQKNVPLSYELMSSKKGTKRYRTSEINELLEHLIDAEERKDSSLKDIMRRIFHTFDERHSKWLRVVECMAVLDVFISLTLYSRGSEVSLCRPEFIALEDGVEPMLEIRDGHHPCVSKTFEGGDFIPNDTLIGVKDENDNEDPTYSLGKIVVVTGPNMGGKSTLMRQAGLIVIMAQMGCYVPAEKCRLTPVDRIFTRLGASDRIMAGESTFFVELSETSSILQHASKHSLILMDELGRGTATYDGTAIASSVMKMLSDKIQCRTLFSTHYYSLVEEFRAESNIQLGHMACMVENECDDDPSQETITFLYKFVKGACPKSYGFNAARLAGIVEEVIQSAIKKAGEFEHDVEKRQHFRNLWHCEGSSDLMEIISQITC